MAFTIIGTMAQGGDDLYYDKAFRLVLETHLQVLVNRGAVSQIPLELFYQYEGDFYGYLTELSVPPAQHFLYLRMNGMTNPNQFAKEMRDPSNPAIAPVLIQPNPNMLDSIVRYYMSRKF